MSQKHITMRRAYELTETHTAQSLGMTHAGQPVQELAYICNCIYTVLYASGETLVVFSPDSEQPITVNHTRTPRTHQRHATTQTEKQIQ